MTAKPFAVGDIVVIINTAAWSSNPIYTVSRVKRVLKPYLVIEDDTKWKHNGYPHPRYQGYHAPRIEHIDNPIGQAGTDIATFFLSHYTALANLRNRVKRRISDLKWDQLTLEQLTAIDQALP